jgi:hypothetical protein
MSNGTRYENFRAALYVRALDIAPLKDDIRPMTETFETLFKYVRFGKVYLETHRDMVIPDEGTLAALRDWLRAKGIAVSGGITVTIDEAADFKTYCYSDPYYRDRLKSLVEMTARLFDEIVFDDFFFNNCKCPKCVATKGEQTWTKFRLDLMAQASRELVLAPAKAVNPKVEVVIKYPNWYDHFQGLGFNLEVQPPLYDGLYTGNETRDAYHGAQHLQPYESYLVQRFYENIKPGGVRGGWVDPFGSNTLDRYAEQLWLTLLAKSPEITLFDYHSIQIPVRDAQRGAWQGTGTSFSFDGATACVRNADGTFSGEANHSVAAGAALEKIDKVLPLLGNPVGVKMYKPYHSLGEDFLVNYLGMIGLPMDLVPQFPEESNTVVLSAAAAHDPDLVAKIKKQLMDGKTVVITTGLLGLLQDKGLWDIVEMRRTDRKMVAEEFQMGWNPATCKADKPFLVPVVEYHTNDSWEIVSCNCGAAGTPMFHAAAYGNSKLFVLTIPENPAELYHLPAPVIGRIARTIAQDMPVHLEAPAQVSLFCYDNDTVVVHSFRDEPAEVNLVVGDEVTEIQDLFPETTPVDPMAAMFGAKPEAPATIIGSEEIEGGFGRKTGLRKAAVTLKPHSFKVFRINRKA